MPTFCRHNRFVDRCPICRESVPGISEKTGASRARSKEGRRDGDARTRRGGGEGHRAGRGRSSRGRGAATAMRVYVDGSQRGSDDGYRNELAPGLRSSQDAQRLAEEIGFATGRLAEVATAPAGMYAQVRELGLGGELERASWRAFLIAYLCPLQGDDPFSGVAQLPDLGEIPMSAGVWQLPQDALDGVPLGPRTSHSPERGVSTLQAYLAWAQRSGSQRDALAGEASWSAQRRFQRIFERLALPGFSRAGRYELLVLLGRLGLYEMSADSLHLSAAGAPASRSAAATRQQALGEPVLDAAKRVLGIGDALNLERRAGALAQACGAPIEALDLALFNWAAPERATLGVDSAICDEQTLQRSHDALGL